MCENRGVRRCLTYEVCKDMPICGNIKFYFASYVILGVFCALKRDWN